MVPVRRRHPSRLRFDKGEEIRWELKQHPHLYPHQPVLPYDSPKWLSTDDIHRLRRSYRRYRPRQLCQRRQSLVLGGSGSLDFQGAAAA
ncbi:hypothetical protein TRIATDRAFT_298857 [Trichoderma atroviride IMI 206040]|uniref:Uncharacterized protein n=1 Tax=Hypocrea atroviridis (strain ATCC 20476 / IMI 206040) TaxID=452589 RepID=G9NR86_HYPAI|nr:uncharacterized protein TRIATDRAFT_298857 [Trichoderma atroviride IMI 206040]EHK47054.1 hypothetical protein TRIATDRAFT_298857 [Trichoderma atroviride IMI 206040]